MKAQPPLLDIEAALFTVGELANVAGIKRGVADVWVHRGIIVPTRVAHVSGRKRPLFSIRAVFKARLVHLLHENLATGPTESALVAKESETVKIAGMLDNEDWILTVLRNMHRPTPLEIWAAVNRDNKRWQWKLFTDAKKIGVPFGSSHPFMVLPLSSTLLATYKDCKRLHDLGSNSADESA